MAAEGDIMLRESLKWSDDHAAKKIVLYDSSGNPHTSENPLPIAIIDSENNAITPTQPTDIQLAELIPVLRSLILAIANPSYIDKSANQMRAQVTGSVTATVASTAITTIDSYQGKLLMVGINNDAWANTCRRLIT